MPFLRGVEISNDTALRLREKYKNFCVMKEAGGKVEKVRDLCARADGKIDVMSGDDGLTRFHVGWSQGRCERGVKHNTAMSNFVKLIEEGRLDEARAVNEKLSGFSRRFS
ncbi:MAG: dihydrodipicolinate synthase family protein [Bacilli bacterium]